MHDDPWTDEDVFWAAYRKGKSDGIDGVKYDAYMDNVAPEHEQTARTGYAEGYHDGNMRRAH